ncbi:hypothetical protein ABTX85_07535 [Streptomyces sp. NPDC096097]|uniref:hypothetical protein n=1 Tax=Streptomyces sp. NPDC096097 TaxID=3155546 RepID=UPI00332B1F1E
MARTSRKQRFAMFAVSAAFVTGGALVPTSAFAAEAAPHTAEATAFAAGHGDHAKSGHGNADGKHGRGDKERSKDRSKGKKHSKPRDVQNMPGCKFYQGKVYCEHKPEAAKPDPAKPDTAKPDTAKPGPAPAGGFGIELKI